MRVGIVGDLHLPFAHPCYLDFCADVFDAWSVERVVMIGDVVDNHAISFWDADPDGHSASREADLALQMLDDWRVTFNKSLVCIGNHDALHFRRAKKAGLPVRFLQDYGKVWGTPHWSWSFHHEIDGVRYEHGTGGSGPNAAITRAINNRCSLVMGHTHSSGGVRYHANRTDRIFGLNVGCGIDCDAYAFEYGRDFPNRPTLGCGIVIDGVQAFFEIMPCGPGETYARSNK